MSLMTTGSWCRTWAAAIAVPIMPAPMMPTRLIGGAASGAASAPQSGRLHWTNRRTFSKAGLIMFVAPVRAPAAQPTRPRHQTPTSLSDRH